MGFKSLGRPTNPKTKACMRGTPQQPPALHFAPWPKYFISFGHGAYPGRRALLHFFGTSRHPVQTFIDVPDRVFARVCPRCVLSKQKCHSLDSASPSQFSRAKWLEHAGANRRRCSALPRYEMEGFRLRPPIGRGPRSWSWRMLPLRDRTPFGQRSIRASQHRCASRMSPTSGTGSQKTSIC